MHLSSLLLSVVVALSQAYGPPTTIARLLVFPPENGDREAVKRLVGRLRDDRVDDLTVRVLFDPGRDLLAQIFPLLRHRRREDLHAVESRRRVVLMLCHRCVGSFWRLYRSPV